ncbi:MAG: hypothetical protein Q9167_004850 [Letrouitia subvulpina]
MANLSATSNVKAWLPNIDPLENQKVQYERLGLAGCLYQASYQVISLLVTHFSESDIFSDLRHQKERLFLWGQGVRATEGQLDSSLSHAPQLYHCVLSLLYELGQVVSEDIFESAQPSLAEKKIHQGRDDLRMLLQKAESVLLEADVPLYCDKDSGMIEYHIGEALEDIADWIDRLMDISLTLEPASMEMTGDDRIDSNPIELNVSQEARLYCRKIRDRFPDLSHQLVEAYGEANATRYKLKEHQINSNLAADTVAIVSGAEVTDTTRSTKFSAIFDEPGQAEDDDHSLTSLPSVSTTAAATKGWRPRVPNLPEKALRGESFTCLACGKSINDIDNRRSWKKHVFADLRPYSCTFPKCKRNNELFQSHAAWVEHEITHRNFDFIRRCPFCQPSKMIMEPKAYFRHVAIHLREVSLAIIAGSAPVDDMDDFGGNSQSDVEVVEEEEEHTENSRSNAEVEEKEKFAEHSLTDAEIERLKEFELNFKIVLHGLHGEAVRIASIDTDSHANMISNELAKSLAYQIKPTSIQSITLGSALNPLGETIVQWSVWGKSKRYSSTFLVLDDKDLRDIDVLIGKETVSKIGLFKIDPRVF